MSAIALILKQRGYAISGSDSRENQNTQKLISEGVEIFNKQNGTNIKTICKRLETPPVIVISSAINNANPELIAAKQARLEVIHRSDLLASLMNEQQSVAIAGSHGKTTTSTMMTTLLAIAKQDPTAAIGGFIPFYQSNGHAGKGELFIAEADESDGSLIKLQPKLGVITNLELDHTDHYSNLQEVIHTMKIFAKGCKKLLLNYDCPVLKEHFSSAYWWSIKNYKTVQFAAIPVSLKGNQTIADIYEEGRLIDQIHLPMPGLHNLSNAIAAIAACRMEGISFTQLKKGLRELTAPGRRFEFRGFWRNCQVVDDYAHHPSEIKATLEMARLMMQSGKSSLPIVPKRIVVIFQPHRYSRTYEFINEFANALSKADCIVLTPIYPAGERPIKDFSSLDLAKKIKGFNNEIPIINSEGINSLPQLLKTLVTKEDLIIAMGAGDINTLWSHLKNFQETDECKVRAA